MKRDFTLKKYKELLLAIGPGDWTVRSYLSNRNQRAIIRHDVDRPPKNVLEMAKLESNLGIETTYYIRVKKKLFDRKIISQVKELGHEVGYHYETLDKARGDYSRAIKIFSMEWKLFKIWNAKTICMHGNPFSRYDNKDLWKNYNFKNFFVLGEAYLSVNFKDRNYFTDTGRSWNEENSVIKDKINNKLINIKDTNNLINFIKEKGLNKIYILTHPSKWNDSYMPWLIELVYQNIKNIAKLILVKFIR